jgi:predicted amidophosphoribosyltransferase
MTPDMPHVRSIDGRVVWRVRVQRGETTCRTCYETVPAGEDVCWRCGTRISPATVTPTLSYLKAGEYELA